MGNEVTVWMSVLDESMLCWEKQRAADDEEKKWKKTPR
jgi:hypothetical protein